ncbi:MAG: helix-turn-helix transcriptional regulator [Clostridia bacterium]|nr:helix-turn-helix transcriptional regulator [Clostridia bacterium]
MDLGNKIFELRKKNNYSQEHLAEQVGVSRQTISKWELGETAPDIKQAQLLSQVFNVSLDELTGNDTKEVIYEKVSNTEKLAGIVIKILKALGVLILISIVATIISLVALIGVRQNVAVHLDKSGVMITENIGKEEYYIKIGSDGTFDSSEMPKDMRNEIIDMIDFDDLDKTADNIKKYFIKLREDMEYTTENESECSTENESEYSTGDESVAVD